MLLRGRIDALLANALVFNRHLEFMNIPKHKLQDAGFLDTIPVHIGFSPK